MAEFENHLEEFQARETAIVAASVDSPTDAAKMQEEAKLTFGVAHSVDVSDFAKRFGAFYEPERGFLHATGFVLKADGTVAHAVYATGSIGRLTPPATIRAIDYLISQGG